ncbi:uncharacterized protein LOC135144012 isoform X2 [Zophobas morio]
MEEELNTIEKIHRRNMKQFKELKDSVKALPVFDIVSPVSVDHFKQIKRQYLQEEDDGFSTVEKYNSEYNSLLEQEDELLNETGKLQKQSKRLKLDIERTEKEYSMLKKMYQEQKSALHVAKNLYETSFGIRINVTDKTCNDKFTATVCCHEENFPVKFLMSRTSRTVTDFDASYFLTQEESEDLKNEFNQSSDPLALICALKEKVTNKLN